MMDKDLAQRRWHERMKHVEACHDQLLCLDPSSLEAKGVARIALQSLREADQIALDYQSEFSEPIDESVPELAEYELVYKPSYAVPQRDPSEVWNEYLTDRAKNKFPLIPEAVWMELLPFTR